MRHGLSLTTKFTAPSIKGRVAHLENPIMYPEKSVPCMWHAPQLRRTPVISDARRANQPRSGARTRAAASDTQPKHPKGRKAVNFCPTERAEAKFNHPVRVYTLAASAFDGVSSASPAHRGPPQIRHAAPRRSRSQRRTLT